MIEIETYYAIKYGDVFKLKDLGPKETINLHFRVEIEKGVYNYPIHLASAAGQTDCLKYMLLCPNIDIDVKDEQTGTNAFWLAAFYGRGEICAMLANSGANILLRHPETGSNALHVAIERKHFMVAKMLIQSKFPVNDTKKGGITPLILISRDKSKEAVSVAHSLTQYGANIDQVTDLG